MGPHLLSPSVWNYLSQNGYSCILWNCIAYEWEDINGWVEPTLERCRSQPHSVVVLHDLSSIFANSVTPAAGDTITINATSGVQILGLTGDHVARTVMPFLPAY